VGDPWDDEGFGGEDDWVGQESVEVDLEDELELNLEDLDELELGEGELGDDE
jgi:hypothetical protein